jgi:hypothetical protein
MMAAAREADKIAVSGLSDLIAGANENLGVEFKAWMDTGEAEHRAKLARHIAALANHGGGYLPGQRPCNGLTCGTITLGRCVAWLSPS